MARVALAAVLAAAVTASAGTAPSTQVPDAGWGVTGVKPREVSRIYWDLRQTTEVLVRLLPVDPDGKPLRVNLVFHAFFPGRETREWNTGRPAWPKGPPARLAVTAEAFPLTFSIPELSLRLNVDGTLIDLTAPGTRHRHIPCAIPADDCAPRGVEADLNPDVLAAIVAAGSVRGHTLGFPFELEKADTDVLAEFAARIGLGTHISLPPARNMR